MDGWSCSSHCVFLTIASEQLHMTLFTHIHTHALCTALLYTVEAQKRKSIICESGGEESAPWLSLKDTVQSTVLKAPYGVVCLNVKPEYMNPVVCVKSSDSDNQYCNI